MKDVLQLWEFRYFIVSSIVKEIRTSLARSYFGVLWLVLRPLAQVAIYAIILSSVLSAKLPNIDSPYAYAIYLMAGILMWNLFSDIFSKNTAVFIENANLIKKLSFPKLSLPLITIGGALVNNLLLLVSIMVIFLLFGHTPSFAILWLPLLMLLVVLFALGFGVVVGILHLFLRDIGQFLPIFLQLLFWGTPIVYMSAIIPERFAWLISLNPLSRIVSEYQNILVYGELPDFSNLIYPALSSLISIALALFLYQRASSEMADVL